jgi:hypothetical protein
VQWAAMCDFGDEGEWVGNCRQENQLP